MKMLKLCRGLLSVGVLTAAGAAFAAEPLLTLNPSDHVCIIGNTLADRMQHHGWLETFIHNRFPKHALAFRNLGFSGDELTTRLRSQDFGSPDEWLTRTQADVILAFFGFNESFAGPAGLEKFKQDLDKFIKDALAQKYNGKSTPRLVLFSPIANEKLPDSNFADPAANNVNIQLYATAMANVAKANGVPFVDLFAPSQQLYAQAKQPLTHNGLHLTEVGDRALAPVIFKAIFGSDPATAGLEKLRAAVLEKNEVWFSRYRTVDGYNVYGGRSKMSYASGKSGVKILNFEVMQQEMAVRDVMTANRDKRVWAVAQGSDLKVDDSNVPPVTKVETNKPGKNPDGSHPFLRGERAIELMTVPDHVKVQLFASEEQWPELVNPVQMAWDTKGRLWVAAWKNYPERTPWDKTGDSLLVFEDTNGDGKADKMTKFIGGLNCPTGFQFYKDGVLLMQAPDLWFVRDTDGDGKADVMERVLDGMDSADTHHTANALVLDPGGAIYLSDGVFHRTQVETAAGPVRNTDGAIYRMEPRTGKFERYVAYGFANPHGRVFDYWGNDIITDATGNANYFGPAFSGHIDYPAKHSGMKQFWTRPSRPCPGTGMLSSRAWPDEFNGNFLNCNVIGIQGIFRVKVTEDGSGLKGDTLEHLVTSDDPNFRPTAVSTGPDGAVYFCDWSNAIIGHLQHHLRDPNRDHAHGRIYRLTYEGRPLLKPAKIVGEPIEKLLDLLKEPENDVRTRAKIELGTRDTAQVLSALKRWIASLDSQDPAYQHHLTEALWLHQWFNVVNVDLLKQMLRSPDYRARAAATRVLCYWRDRVPDPLGLLKPQANDEQPRVRLEAVRACSFFDSREAAEVALESLSQSQDYYLKYTLDETMRQLDRFVAQGGGFYIPKNPHAAAYVLDRLNNNDLVKAPRVEPVLNEFLERRGLAMKFREEALEELAKLHKTDELAELLAALERNDAKGDETVSAQRDLSLALAKTKPEVIVPKKAVLESLLGKAKLAATRQAVFVGLITAEGKANGIWENAAGNHARLADLIGALPMVRDTKLRNEFQPKVALLVQRAPTSEIHRLAIEALPSFRGHEAGSFAALAELITTGSERTAAVDAMLRLPRTAWQKDHAGSVAQSIVDHAAKVRAAQRTERDFLELTRLGNELSTLLPPDDGQRIRKALGDLGVKVITLKTLREQMFFDKTRIVVETGRPVQIIFENPDAMPHNLCIVAPGAREEIGRMAETMPPKPDKQGRAFIPRSKKVLFATKLVEPEHRTKLDFVAPEKPGDYPYVCTFPGHWMRMFGTMVVTDDVEAYLAKNPESALPKITEWKIEDFAEDIKRVGQHRSFESGKGLFNSLSCIKCHQLGKEGTVFGPNLGEVFTKYKGEAKDVLAQIITPSRNIDDKYRNWSLDTGEESTPSGIILAEDSSQVTIQSGPGDQMIQRIPKGQIKSRRKSDLSIMPAGLLNMLNKEQILDLVAYLKSLGNPNDPAFHHAH